MLNCRAFNDNDDKLMDQSEIAERTSALRQAFIQGRKAHGWTQRDAAEALKWERAKVGMLETTQGFKEKDLMHIASVYGEPFASTAAAAVFNINSNGHASQANSAHTAQNANDNAQADKPAVYAVG